MPSHHVEPIPLYVLSGPNGAGKSTTAPLLFPNALQVHQFVNADNIALGLSPFAPETTAMQAGRLMIQRIHELLAQRQAFAFETTLAGRRTLPLMEAAHQAGDTANLIYIWLATPELAISRVADRVRQGGHAVVEGVIRRRYDRGLVNFFRLYRPLADTWTLCDNSWRAPSIVAQGNRIRQMVLDENRLGRIEHAARDAEKRIGTGTGE